MRKILVTFYFSFLTFDFFGQTITQKLQKAFTTFEKDSQLKHAISSLYVIDANTGLVVFDKNSQIGLAPASTQKIITSVTAFELLGKDYKYTTELRYEGEIEKNILDGNLILYGYGDPTFCSWRYESTKEEKIFQDFAEALNKNGIKTISGIIEANSEWQTQYIPDGWIWQDIGNYYGAGVGGFNWRENQFDLLLESGNQVGDVVSIVSTKPELFEVKFISEAKSAEKNSGDNAYLYFPIDSKEIFLRGTIPIGEKKFQISGAVPDPRKQAAYSFAKYLSKRNPGEKYSIESIFDIGTEKIQKTKANVRASKAIYTHYSPTLDSIIYWFNKKSINLYGEALMKTFAYEKKGFGSTDSGVAIVKRFWKEKGMDENELNIVDGSGLSPLNRVTTHSQVEILKYAKGKDWFPYFFTSLPEYNGMKIKSGTIRGVKGFCGYHKAKNGKEYIFSFLVNNYNGSASLLVNKMYKVLDTLK